MRGKTMILIAGFALAGMILAPTADAFAVGIDAKGVKELKAAGGSAKYGQVWVGKWVLTNGWSGVESDIRAARDAGVIPVILWYYWGDSISVDAVKYGKNGMSKSQWDSMAKELAVRTKNIMGSKEFIVVLEPEFNKNGISSWETFDGYLENQANLIKGAAPAAKIVVGFGHWGGYDLFDRAMSKASYSGFQMMRASTRDTVSKAEGAASESVQVAKTLKSKFGKGVLIYDLAISSYGGWNTVQEKSLKNFGAKRSELDAAGVVGIVYRYTRDNSHSSGYFGSAEKYWGLKTSSGYSKPVWDDFVAISKGSSSGSTSSTSTTASSTTTGTTGTSFSSVKVGEWWVETKVTSSKSISKVEVRVNGGSWTALAKQSWGAYAKSVNVKSGQYVEFRATASDGSTTTSAKYARGGTTTTSTSSTSGSFDASFSSVKVGEWWIQTNVAGTKSVAKVEARVNGGSWTTLSKQSWGAYAKSVNVKSGQYVEFRATASDGSTDLSGKYWR